METGNRQLCHHSFHKKKNFAIKLIYVIFSGGEGRGGYLLTFLNFRVGTCSRWVLIPGVSFFAMGAPWNLNALI